MDKADLLLAIVVAAGALSCLGTRTLVTVLRRGAVLDRPNERSSHSAPTPRGGGLAVVAAILLGWSALVLTGAAGARVLIVLAGATLIAAVSWLDDLRGLPPASRLLAQFAAVAGALLALPSGAVFQALLPPAMDAGVTVLLWVWFINLFNFMDGIDGIAGSEAAAIGLGVVLFASFGVNLDAGVAALSAVVAAAAIGFLVWNWAPAQIFLGDVGSVPLGYLLGFLLLSAARHGHWKIALILPLYFLADATITLGRRLIRGERVWQAHREHFYQRAVQRGLGHADVVRRVILADLVLIACGWAAENGAGLAALAGAVVLVAVLLANLAGLRPAGWQPIPAPKPRVKEPPS